MYYIFVPKTLVAIEEVTVLPIQCMLVVLVDDYNI